jgi:hypothetical protein
MKFNTGMSWLLSVLFLVAGSSVVVAENIEQAMSPEEFRAAGLDKLSAAELVELNLWLARRGSGETASAAAPAVPAQAATSSAQPATAPVVDNGPPILAKNRSPGAPRPVETTVDEVNSRLVGYFEGWRKGTIFKLENGQHWRVIDDRRFEVSSEDSPLVRIKRGFMDSWMMKFGDYNRGARVQRIK